MPTLARLHEDTAFGAAALVLGLSGVVYMEFAFGRRPRETGSRLKGTSNDPRAVAPHRLRPGRHEYLGRGPRLRQGLSGSLRLQGRLSTRNCIVGIVEVNVVGCGVGSVVVWKRRLYGRGAIGVGCSAGWWNLARCGTWTWHR